MPARSPYRENEPSGAAGRESGHGDPRGAVRRRRFLKAVCVVPATLAVAGRSVASRDAGSDESRLPRVPFGPHRISRLVCGANPFHAGSHLSAFVNRDMRDYYTTERKLATLRRCQEVGINLWQGSNDHHEIYRLLREQGGEMQYISLGAAGGGAQYLKELTDVGCIGVAHHGEVTDRLFKSGKLDEVHDYLQMVRDTGMMVGVSTHMPDVVDVVESKGWDIDFYMTCVYERHRSRDELKKLLGRVPIRPGEVYLEEDPPRMYRMIQQTRRTCLAFKILAAGRLCDRKEWVEEAFRQTFAAIKPSDAVIVGLWDKYSDQPAENAAYVRRFSAPTLHARGR